MNRVGLGAIVTLWVLVSATHATAQRIVGVVQQAGTAAPLSGVVISVIDPTGRAETRSISNDRGRYAVPWSQAGARLRVVRIGFKPVTLSLPAGAPRDTTINLTMERAPVTLQAVRVSSRAVCAATGGSAAALELWDQARAALLNSIVARTAMPANATNLLYQQDLDPQTRRVIRQQSRITRGTVTRPFITGMTPAELAARGYRIRRNGEEIFHGPDADVLFDDTFTQAHCFGTRMGDDRRVGLVALTFEPRRAARRGSIVDVRGDLWIDPKNNQLVELEFKYTGVDDAARRAGIGGVIHFQTLENGIVFIDHWSISLVTLQQISNSSSFRVTGANESGGFILAAHWPDSTRHTRLAGAATGVVKEKWQPAPAMNVVVALDGVDTTLTDATGTFLFGLLPGGLYSVTLADTSYQAFTAPRIVRSEVRITRGETLAVALEIPSRESVLRDLCRRQAETVTGAARGVADGRAIIIGRIGDGSRRVPPDLRVEGRWNDAPEVGRPGSSVTLPERGLVSDADDEGNFYFCVPSDRRLRMRALAGRLPIADTVIFPYDSGARTVDWTLPTATFVRATGQVAALTGRVLTASEGVPVPDAEVRAATSSVPARTDSSGRFRLYGLRAGNQVVQIRKIGFGESRDTVTLQAGREVVRDFPLEANVVTLDAMRTTSPMVAYRKPMLQQFEQRRRAGTGRFIAEDVLRKHDEQTMNQFLVGRLGGVTFVGYKSAILANSIRNPGNIPAIPLDSRSPKGCWVSLFVDGMPIYTGAPSQNAPDLSSFRVDEYAGIEFYPGGASTPAQYNQTRESNCGVLLLWTREHGSTHLSQFPDGLIAHAR